MDSDKAQQLEAAGFKVDDLEWISSLQHEFSETQETAGQKFMRKLRMNPVVPIGCGLTVTALGLGLWNFKSGRGKSSQLMMRLRVLAQGFTLAALLGGMVFNHLRAVDAKAGPK